MKKVIFVALIVGCLLVHGCGRNYSQGSRVGVVTKLSYKGFVWKTWEGQMNLGGLTEKNDAQGHSQMVANTFDFNVDPSCVAKVQEAMRSGKRVELVYRQWAVKPPSIENNHVIIDVKETQ